MSTQLRPRARGTRQGGQFAPQQRAEPVEISNTTPDGYSTLSGLPGDYEDGQPAPSRVLGGDGGPSRKPDMQDSPSV
ncbi:hypothetical protein BN13_280003 [Nostocoides jenkinsii Ben 74]|uniref:Uncharacterized protein n=1 Tax=Nostocoides jenkinsii Ben 74 TaxID=1193518 RepID=A0A077M6V3_9MICO|nr:hypothetical protein BN13_280003 [Tetrasphaera jenkinsii Ben 74]